MTCDSAAGPAPDLHIPGVEIRILLQDREVDWLSSLSQKERSETGRNFLSQVKKEKDEK
jgi:hypothetical protein